MMTHLDTSVGAIVKSLEETNMLKDSIIVFTTDNGGVFYRSIVLAVGLQQYHNLRSDKCLHF